MVMPYKVAGSSVELDLAPSGVTCRVMMPLARITPASGGAKG
jgi:hypothetical protein